MLPFARVVTRFRTQYLVIIHFLAIKQQFDNLWTKPEKGHGDCNKSAISPGSLVI